MKGMKIYAKEYKRNVMVQSFQYKISQGGGKSGKEGKEPEPKRNSQKHKRYQVEYYTRYWELKE